MARQRDRTVKNGQESFRTTTREDQDSLYGQLFPNPNSAQHCSDPKLMQHYADPNLVQHYAARVGLRTDAGPSGGGFPDQNSFFSIPKLSRGQQMVQAAKENSPRSLPSFSFSGVTYSRQTSRRQEPRVFPGYVVTRASDNEVVLKGSLDQEREKEVLTHNSRSKNEVTEKPKMDTLRFFSSGRNMGTEVFQSSKRCLRSRESKKSPSSSAFTSKGESASTTLSTKRKSSSSSSSSSSSDERRRIDEVIDISVNPDGRSLTASYTTPGATRRRRRDSSLSERDDYDDFDWTQINHEQQFIEYPKDSSRRLIVFGRDLCTLKPGHFLNDSIIDFYFKYLETEGLSVEIRSRAYFFSCFFYKRLIERGKHEDEGEALSVAAKRHDRVKTWTRTVDLFAHDYIVIPVNKGSHWFLVVVCHAGKAFQFATASSTSSIPPVSASSSSRPCILVFDSMGVKCLAAKAHAKTILMYLQEEYKSKKKVDDEAIASLSTHLPWFAPKVPLQPNGSDCGVYALHFAEKFLRSPFVADSDEEFRADRRGWFDRAEVAGKRGQIRDLILRLGGFS